jgi:hypothetical protein
MSLEGKWNLVIKTPFGQQKMIADIAQQAEGLGGTLANDKGPAPLKTARVEADEAWFEGTVKTPFGDLNLAFHGVIQENKIFGKVKTTFGMSDFSGTRE